MKMEENMERDELYNISRCLHNSLLGIGDVFVVCYFLMYSRRVAALLEVQRTQTLLYRTKYTHV